MANSITLAERYLPLLDEVYKRESLTARFDATSERVRFIGAQTVQIYKTSMQGLGDYNRNTGFVAGDVTGEWETMELGQDRGRSFMVDVMDNEETLGMAFGTLAGEFIRTQVVPELDAYRFSSMAGFTGILSATAADISASSDVAGMLDAAESAMGDAEVPVEGRVCFMSETAYAALKDNITRYLANENGVQRNVETYNGMPIIRVPKARFNTGITLTANGAGGYTIPATTSYPINFMIVHPSAIVQITKHVIPRIFSPEVNQTADAWKFDYRIYHDIFAYENKTKGIYLHRAATANK
nr:MAG TPA: Major capsid protein [Caudoviricetes sp.]